MERMAQKSRSACLKVPKIYGEQAINLANSMNILDTRLKIVSQNDSLYIPLVRRTRQRELQTIKEAVANCHVLIRQFAERLETKPTHLELMKGKIPEHLLPSVPRAIDFVGEIAIIEIPPALFAYRNTIGQSILKAHRRVKTVLAKGGAVRGKFRLRDFDVIAGKHTTETIHKEYGCRYYVDVARAYFSPRLSFEHKRVTSLTREGETVVDLFAGVGPFTILIARTHKDVRIFAVDMNPDAIQCLETNVRLNRVSGKAVPILGEAKRTVEERLRGLADRVIMNLPGSAIEYVAAACEALKLAGGILHFYSFVDAARKLEDVKLSLVASVEECGRRVEKILFTRVVRATAPYERQVVLDLEIH